MSVQQGSAAKGLALVLSFPISLVSHFIVFPIAIWNHNLLVGILALLAPLLYIQTLKFLGVVRSTKGGKKPNMRNRVIAHAFIIVFGILLWNHLWWAVLIAVVVFMALNTKIVTAKKK